MKPLQSILEAREQRALLKSQLALKGLPCLSLSLNVPGFPKSNPVTKAFFSLCLTDLKYFLKAHLIEIHPRETIERCDAAGDFFLASLSKGMNTLPELKQLFENFEESHPLGRFIDLDLNDELGNTVSSGKSKLCFYCLEKPAIECRRENAHDSELLRSFMFSKMNEYCSRQRETNIARQISSLGLKALLYEITLSPKPGLVDRISDGSHGDMSYHTFIDSSSAISPWFVELVLAGFHFQGSDLTKALPIVRNLGLRMESSMFEATGNVNTQKGIIFLLGLSMFACGRLFSQGDGFDVEQFRGIIKEVCSDMVEKELTHSRQHTITHGRQIFKKYGFSGARGEAQSGFRTVFEYGLPLLTKISKLTDHDLIKSFLSIASNTGDTNILYRGGPQVLKTFQDLCKSALKDLNVNNYSAVMDFCDQENISPGGSADLLVVTIFVWEMMNNPFPPFIPNIV